MQSFQLPKRAFTVPIKSYKQEDWQGGNQSLKEEFDYSIEDVEGEIPPDLQGTLFRNVPAMLDVNGQRLRHPFDGDGMICKITFSKGRAHFRNRFVRTEGYLAEKKANKILYRGVFGTQKPGGWLENAFDFRAKNVANINVIYWDRKLLALWEAAPPYRLDPQTLETLGMETLGSFLHEGSPFGSHPKIDPGGEDRETRLVAFGIKAGLSSEITIYELDQIGRVVKQHAHLVPGVAFMHDFAVTPNYCIFFQNPLFFNPLPYIFGFRGAAECIFPLANQPTKIWVIPRDETKGVQVFETEPSFIFHHANAFEQGDEVIVDSISYQNLPTMEFSYQDFDFEKVPPGQLCRFRLNLKAKITSRQLIDLRSVEFPYVHPSCIGQPHRWVFLGAAHRREGNAPLQAIFKIDPESGQQEVWSAAPHGFVSEPIFVPRPDSSVEDDGWILTLVYDSAHHRSDVVILDARDLNRGSVARLHLKHHIPYGLHGCFTSESLV